MPYSKDLTKALIDLIGLAPGSQKIADLWLSHWDGCHLPSADAFQPAKLGRLATHALFHEVKPDESARILHCGRQLAKWAGEDLTGCDWIDLALPKFRSERIRRCSAVARGAIMRTTRQIESVNKISIIETISLPLMPGPNGRITIAQFIAVLPENGEGHPLRDFTVESDTVEFIPIVLDSLRAPPEEIVSKALKPEERAKIISRAVARFLLGVCADTLAAYPKIGLDPIDLLLANLIGSANISHIENDPELRRQYAGLIEPDWIRRGISRAAVSRALTLPFETTRRRLNRMIERGILIERPDGIILSGSNPHKLDSNTARMLVHAQLTERFWRELKARGIAFG
jgi:hypothetical protein